MKEKKKQNIKAIFMNTSLTFLMFLLIFISKVSAFTLRVQDKNGNPVSGFRWLLEERYNSLGKSRCSSKR